jgi:hypothetical protein
MKLNFSGSGKIAQKNAHGFDQFQRQGNDG